MRDQLPLLSLRTIKALPVSAKLGLNQPSTVSSPTLEVAGKMTPAPLDAKIDALVCSGGTAGCEYSSCAPEYAA